MATYNDLHFTIRFLMKSYPFSRYRLPPTGARLLKPLSQSRLALITTAGFYLPSQPNFEQLSMGDPSFREIPNDVDMVQLRDGHNSSSFDHEGVRTDRNLALPLERFRELQQSQQIGSLNHRHFSFMGSIIKPAPLINETAPTVAKYLQADGVDAVFLTPV
jgi:D-proline reductase (dithiol) PrdB